MISSLDGVPANPAVVENRVEKNEYFFVGAIIALVILLTTLPYLLAFSVGNTFVGQIYNIVDYCVYLSWTKQAADGHFSTLNLFTTIKQHGYLFNLLFLLLGNFVRFSGLSIAVVFQIFRVGGAILLLWIAYLLCRLAYPSSFQARLTAFGLIGFSSGFGFVYWPQWSDKNVGHFSVDVWQPEAFTFLSIYVSVLFVVATIFILTAMYNLVRGELTGRWIYGVNAGICGLVLGNIHSYDVLHIAAAWGLYLVVVTIAERKFDRGRWLRAVIAGAMTLPTTVYQYWVFKHEPVFHARAETPTLSPPLFYYAMGYGLVFILAIVGAFLLAKKWAEFSKLFRNNIILTWVCTWATAGLTIIYLPVEFQRKMAMGTHIPLCILAGGAATYLARSIPERIRSYALCTLVILTFPTNALFLLRDYRHIELNRSEISAANPFLLMQQLDVLTWLRDNTKEGEAVLALPPIGQFVPGYCDRAVWVGHWSETPNYGEKLSKLLFMLSSSTPDDVRQRFLEATGTQYLVYPDDVSDQPIKIGHRQIYLEDFTTDTPSYLTPVYQTKRVDGDDGGGYIVYRIN